MEINKYNHLLYRTPEGILLWALIDKSDNWQNFIKGLKNYVGSKHSDKVDEKLAKTILNDTIWYYGVSKRDPAAALNVAAEGLGLKGVFLYVDVWLDRLIARTLYDIKYAKSGDSKE